MLAPPQHDSVAPSHPPPSKDYVERARIGVSEGTGATSTAHTSSNKGTSRQQELWEQHQQQLADGAAVDGYMRMVREYTVWPAKNVFCCWGFCCCCELLLAVVSFCCIRELRLYSRVPLFRFPSERVGQILGTGKAEQA